MFGQNKPFGSTGFGGSGTSGFGTSNTSGFGNANPSGGGGLFGGASGGSGLFGSSTTTTTSGGGLFGGSAFGSNQNTNTGGTGFSFGTNQNPSGGGIFGGASSSTSLFSTPTTNTAFGAKTPGFGTTGGGLFGSTTSSTTSSLFGQSNTGSLFSKPLGTGFGTTTTTVTGTTVKFNPLSGSDTMMKNGVSTSISTKHQCITAMKEYENKSLEELRMEDYAANRKGPQQTGGLFGGFGATQQQQQTSQTGATGGFSLFGQSQQNKPAFGFGGTTSASTGLFGQQSTTNQASGGLFGMKTQTGGLFGTTTITTSGGGFGFNNTSTSLFGGQQKSLFGTTTTTQQTGGLFGSTQTATPAFGTGFGTTGGFGQTTQQSGGLFGSKPLGFGAQTTSSTTGFSFGQTSQSGGGLFGASKPAGPVFNFGGGGTSAFGAPASTSGGLFGNKAPAFGTSNTSFGFGNNTNTLGTGNTAFGTGGGLFGGQNKTGFGFNFNQASNTGLGAGTANLGGLGIGQQAQQQIPNTQAEIQQQLLALAMSPYGDNPLFKNIRQSEVKREDLVLPVSPAAQRAALNSAAQYKVSPRPMAKLKPKPMQSMGQGKTQLFDGLEEDEASTFGNDTFQPRRSIKKLLLPAGGASRSSQVSSPAEGSSGRSLAATPVFTQHERSQGPLPVTSDAAGPSQLVGAEGHPAPSPDTGRPVTPPPGSGTRPTLPPGAMQGPTPTLGAVQGPTPTLGATQGPVPPLGATQGPTPSPGATQQPTTTAGASQRQTTPPPPGGSTAVSSQLQNGLDSTVVELSAPRVRSALEESRLDHSDLDQTETVSDRSSPPPPHPCNIVLRRPTYYTLPSLDELANLVNEDGDCYIEQFVIGREGFGNVMFPDIVNVRDMNLDDIVHFRRKEITIYPDENNKPPVGEGLNQRAQVTLDHVWPMDKSTHLPIKDPDRLESLKYLDKLERASDRIGAKFLDYRPETGSWVFLVKHFSKYGLLDDSDDDDVPTDSKQLEFLKLQQQKTLAVQKAPLSKGDGAQLNGQAKLPGSIKKKVGFEESVVETSPPKMARESSDGLMADLTMEKLPDYASFEVDFLTEDDSQGEGHVPTSHLLAKQLGVKALDLQVRKASLFAEDEEDEDMESAGWGQAPAQPSTTHRPPLDPLGTSTTPRPAMDTLGTSTLFTTTDRDASLKLWGHTGVKGESPAPETLHSPRIIRKSRLDSSGGRLSSPAKPIPGIPEPPTIMSGLPPSTGRRRMVGAKLQGVREYQRSVGYDKEHCRQDMGLFRGRATRASWSGFYTLAHAGPALRHKKDVDEDMEHEVSIFPTTTGRRSRLVRSHPSVRVMVERPALGLASLQDQARALALVYLEAQLEHSIADAPLHLTPSPDTLPAYRDLPDPLGVWGLCWALWGRLQSPLVAEEGEVEEWGREMDRGGHAVRMLRREALSAWLEEMVGENVETEIKELHAQGVFEMTPVREVLSLLTGRRLEAAAYCALDASLHAMALVLSQAESSPDTRKWCQIQLQLWREHKTDEYIDPLVLRFYVLMAGLLSWTTSSRDDINVCQGLDWKRTLATHLWYLSPSTAGVSEAVSLYTRHADNNLVIPPLPPYLEGAKQAPRARQADVRYQLLCLYSDRTHPLHAILDPHSHTDDPLDYTLSWHLNQVLSSLHYRHLSPDHGSRLCISYADQLEALGLWHWSVYIIMHLPKGQSTENAIRELLYRHVSITCSEDLTDEERFVHEKLGVAREWIHKAKAVRARDENLPYGEAHHLLEAKEWNSAHEVIVKHIAADAIVNEYHEMLLNLLSTLSTGSATIQDWNKEGKVYLDYLHMVRSVETLKRGNPTGAELEKLGEEVACLSFGVSGLTRYSPAHNVAQAEMAKKTLNLMKILSKMNAGAKTSSVRPMMEVLKRLPLPEDYALEELNEITRQYLVELTKA